LIPWLNPRSPLSFLRKCSLYESAMFTAKWPALIWPPSFPVSPSISRSSVWAAPRSPDLISRTSHFHWRIRRNSEQNKQRALSVPLEQRRMDLDARCDPRCQSLCRSSFSSSYRPLWNFLKISTHRILFHHH
jgi:hypothetical protein